MGEEEIEIVLLVGVIHSSYRHNQIASMSISGWIKIASGDGHGYNNKY